MVLCSLLLGNISSDPVLTQFSRVLFSVSNLLTCQNMSCQYIFIFVLRFNVEFIQMFKYVGHTCNFSNRTIIFNFKVFKQMLVVVT